MSGYASVICSVAFGSVSHATLRFNDCGSQIELKLLELSENNTPVLNHTYSVIQLCILLHIGAYLRPAS